MKTKSKTTTVYIDEAGVEHKDHKSAAVADIALLLDKEWGHNMFALDAAQIVFDNKDKIADVVRSYNKIDAQKKTVAE